MFLLRKRRAIKLKINSIPRCNFFEDGGVGEENFLFKESFFPHVKAQTKLNKGEPPTRVLPLPLPCKGIHPLLRFGKESYGATRPKPSQVF
jgi:hypothetical protein